MSTQPTPGQWISRQWNDPRNGSNGFDIEAHPDFNAGLPIAVTSGPDCEANARLIASEPDLLAALKAALDILDEHAEDEKDFWGETNYYARQAKEVADAARAAIASFTGDSRQHEGRT